MTERYFSFTGYNSESASVTDGEVTNSGSLFNNSDDIPAGEHWYIDNIVTEAHCFMERTTDSSGFYSINGATGSDIEIFTDKSGLVDAGTGDPLEIAAHSSISGAGVNTTDTGDTYDPASVRTVQEVDSYFSTEEINEILYDATWSYELDENDGGSIAANFEYEAWAGFRARRVD